MSVKLYGRKNKWNQLRLRGEYPDYRTAVVVGRKDYGHGNFMCETKYTPSREQQLLQPKWNPNDLKQL